VTPVLFVVVVVVDEDDDDESDKSVTLGRNSSDGYFDRGLKKQTSIKQSNTLLVILNKKKVQNKKNLFFY
jgi:hypothetical protein